MGQGVAPGEALSRAQAVLHRLERAQPHLAMDEQSDGVDAYVAQKTTDARDAVRTSRDPAARGACQRTMPHCRAQHAPRGV